MTRPDPTIDETTADATDVEVDAHRRQAAPDDEIDERPGFGVVMGRALLAVGMLSLSLSVLALIAWWVFGDTPVGRADVESVEWLADRRNRVLDVLATNGSAMSDTFTIVGVAVAAWWMLWVTDHRRFATMIVLALAIEFLAFLVTGAVVDRARPEVDSLHSTPSTPSYPSGHTASAFAVYGALVVTSRALFSRAIHRTLWLFPVTVALVVAAARVYEGVHYPSDVIAGLLLGTGALGASLYATGIVEAPGVLGRVRSTRQEPTSDESILDRR